MFHLIHTAYALDLPSFSPTQGIGGFMSSLYSFSIAAVGLAIFIQFVRAGYTYFFSSAGNAVGTGNAKTMMTNAVIGAVLLFSAHLILTTINPDLAAMNFGISEMAKNIVPYPGVGLGVDINALRNNQIRAPLTTAQVVPESNAWLQLANAGVTVNPHANLEGISQNTINGLIGLEGDCNCQIDVTGVVNSSQRGMRVGITVGNPRLLLKFFEKYAVSGDRGVDPLTAESIPVGNTIFTREVNSAGKSWTILFNEIRPAQ